MKITIEQKTTKEVEIGFPLFIKLGNDYYAFLSEKSIVSVQYVSNYVWISHHMSFNAVSDVLTVNYETITEEDFQFAFQMAIDKLQKALPVAA